MATKPPKPSRNDDMRRNSNKSRYGTVPNRDKVVPGDVPHPESMKPKEATIDHHQHDDHRQ